VFGRHFCPEGDKFIMKRKKSYDEEIIQVKIFSNDEIDIGITKLQRRIKELESLLQDNVQFDDQQVDTVKHNIIDTIRDVFGQQSSEYDKNKYHKIRHGSSNVGDSWPVRHQKFIAGVPQSISMINGLIQRLEEKREDHGLDPKAKASQVFYGLNLQPRIHDICSDLYHDGHYANAVFDASKALINYIKEKSRIHDLDGTALVRKVFSKNDPILAFNDLSDQTDLDEQEGMMHLFEGFVMGVRNPRGHSFKYDNPERALEYIVLISMLAFKVDESKRKK
jgi:uncharacterized protein (TIGR02391 family)